MPAMRCMASHGPASTTAQQLLPEELQDYRPNVGICLVNRDGLVSAFEPARLVPVRWWLVLLAPVYNGAACRSRFTPQAYLEDSIVRDAHRPTLCTLQKNTCIGPR